MAPTTSLSVIIGIATIAVAVWTQMIEDASKRALGHENRWVRFTDSLMVLSSAILIGTLLVAVAIWSFSSTGIAGILYLILTAVLLAGAPRVAQVYYELLTEARRFEKWWEIGFAVLICLTFLLGVLFAMNSTP